MIHLIGPGGAGKTTVGFALAKRLGIAFVDLDREFSARNGDISTYLAAHGYRAYAAKNIEVYLETRESCPGDAVIALSSGFMTYDADVHPECSSVLQVLVNSLTTIALLPCFDYETCVAETVRRQLRRPFSRTAEEEEQVIRARFELYRTLPVRKFETAGAVDALVEEIVTFRALAGDVPESMLPAGSR